MKWDWIELTLFLCLGVVCSSCGGGGGGSPRSVQRIAAGVQEGSVDGAISQLEPEQTMQMKRDLSEALENLCRHIFEDKEEAQTFLEDNFDQGQAKIISVNQLVQPCEGGMGNQYIVVTRSQFITYQEQLFALPFSYDEILKSYEAFSKTAPVYLNLPINKIPRKGVSACPKTNQGSEILADWNMPRNWPSLSYLAIVFYDGLYITRNDPWASDLRVKLREEFIKIADHILTKANSTDFHGINVESSLFTRVVDPIGWENFASSWDAWTNGTCSPPTGVSGFSSGWALNVLALAYQLTSNRKYMEGLMRGSGYFHSFKTNPYFKPGYDRFEQIKQILNTNAPYAVMANYTVGGSRYHHAVNDSRQMIIRYHYKIQDPARFALNITAILSLAIIRAGKSMPDLSFKISDAQGGAVERTLSNIGFHGMYSVYANALGKNYGYIDVDDVNFTSKKYLSEHLDITLYNLASAGYLLGNARFVDVARQTLLDVIQIVEQPSIYICLSRALDDRIYERCKDIIQQKNIKSLSLWQLFAITAIVKHPPLKNQGPSS